MILRVHRFRRVMFHCERLGHEPSNRKDMTSVIWGIVGGMVLMFATSLYRYMHQAVRLPSPALPARPREDERRG
jgi:hypothetical protein